MNSDWIEKAASEIYHAAAILHEIDDCVAESAIMSTIRSHAPDTDALVEAKNLAYTERNLMVAFLSHIYPAHMKRHPDSDIEWENDWRNIICIHGPAGQMTWHIHDDECHLFDHLYRKRDLSCDCEYDGHTTDTKYKRLSLCAPCDTIPPHSVRVKERGHEPSCRKNIDWDAYSLCDKEPPCTCKKERVSRGELVGQLQICNKVFEAASIYRSSCYCERIKGVGLCDKCLIERALSQSKRLLTLIDKENK